MKIRKIEDKDFRQVNNLYKRLYSEQEPDFNLVGRKLNAQMLSLLAEENGEAVGFISGTVVSYESKIEGQVWDLLVDEDYRKNGIGTQLISEFEKLAKEVGAAYMVVWVDPGPDEENPSLFYKKNGYKQNNYPVLTKKI
jgi:ribosomal protein S18 acetylase RimI-like enzyme